MASITLRRYRCLRCAAVLVVVPRGVLPRLRYGAVAVALALARWSIDGVSAAEVRAAVSPFAFVGGDARRGWHSLRRWARAPPWSVAPGEGSPMQRARRISQHLAGHALEWGELTRLASSGALVVDAHRPRSQSLAQPTT